MNPKAVEIRDFSSFAALVFLMLEYLSNCHSEYKYIWRAQPTPVKYIYLISRYSGLIGQIVHYSLIHVFLIDAPVKPERCRVWFLFLFAICSILVASLDAVLLLRVYALYRQNVKVYILALPLILQFVVGSVMMERVTQSHVFNSYCDKETSPTEIGLFGGTVLLAHAALGLATFAKRNIAGGRAAVVKLVVREGAWIILIFFAIVATSATYAVVFDSANPFAIFVWPTAVISVITCRIILNMNQLKTELPQERGELASTEFHLSTIISRV
ncbi:hypothetical protein BYT27DRAFT_7181294 [Phlegmacium glaucopus]|nr:hypothetical protein BYT27DRAFT_7181294 [Phlegmacium glaucopus]